MSKLARKYMVSRAPNVMVFLYDGEVEGLSEPEIENAAMEKADSVSGQSLLRLWIPDNQWKVSITADITRAEETKDAEPS